MPTPPFSDTTTHGFRVGATGYFMPEESDPSQEEYVFGYRILIVNQSDRPAKLISRHWTIIDAEGQTRHVDGPGVIGQTPHLAPGQAFKYSSFCPLSTTWGTMEGHYRMQYDDGSEFDITVARFYLVKDKLDTATTESSPAASDPETPQTPESSKNPEASETPEAPPRPRK